jgi:hypothetical protein
MRESHLQRANGNYDQARILEDEARQNAPAVSYCGAGSCGLEKVNTSAGEGAEMKALLDVKPGDKLVKFSEGQCKKCGIVGKVYIGYDTTFKKINKGCASCKSTQFKSA